MDQNDSHPKTLEELRCNFAIPPTSELLIETDSCSICLEPFEFSLLSEVPLRLPACGHIFCDTCISTWITKGKSTCPMCLRYVLKIDNPDILDQTRREALPIWLDRRHGRAPTAFALQAEAAFVNLCEAIVCWFENQVIQHDAVSGVEVEQWLENREACLAIISLATFETFAAMSRGPPYYRAGLGNITLRLQESLPDPALIDVVMGYAHQWDGREELVEWSEETRGSLAEWHRRIEQGRNRMYERAYGGN